MFTSYLLVSVSFICLFFSLLFINCVLTIVTLVSSDSISETKLFINNKTHQH